MAGQYACYILNGLSVNFQDVQEEVAMKSLDPLSALLLLQACGSHESVWQNDTPTAQAAWERALLCYREQDYAKAFAWFEEADAKGYGKAACYLGLMYLKGRGVECNPERAWAVFSRAAEQGDAAGQYWLAYLYENGIGTPQDGAAAFYWYRRSARRDDEVAVSAMKALGRLYERGVGVPEDKRQALVWYRRALAAGDWAAETDVARLVKGL